MKHGGKNIKYKYICQLMACRCIADRMVVFGLFQWLLVYEAMNQF